MAKLLEDYVSQGGRLFVEARPGWVDERGHAQPVLPGFGWEKMLGVREAKVIPRKEFSVTWGAAIFPAMTFQEVFEPVSKSAISMATGEDGQTIAYRNRFGKGEAILLGSFAGQANQLKPMDMNPLGDILVEWATVHRPRLISSHFIELRRMNIENGEIVFLFNHGDQSAIADYEIPGVVISAKALDGSPAQVRDRTLHVELPPRSVRTFVIREGRGAD
jgi:hypothetical protein